jgi:hypothetical protein
MAALNASDGSLQAPTSDNYRPEAAIPLFAQDLNEG